VKGTEEIWNFIVDDMTFYPVDQCLLDSLAHTARKLLDSRIPKPIAIRAV
jgi:hypothetical protein